MPKLISVKEHTLIYFPSNNFISHYIYDQNLLHFGPKQLYPKLANNNRRKQGQKNEGFFAYIGLQCHFHHHPLPLAFLLHACWRFEAAAWPSTFPSFGKGCQNHGLLRAKPSRSWSLTSWELSNFFFFFGCFTHSLVLQKFCFCILDFTRFLFSL